MSSIRKYFSSTEKSSLRSNRNAKKIQSLILLSGHSDDDCNVKRAQRSFRITIAAIGIFLFLLGIICILFSVAYILQIFHLSHRNNRIASLLIHSKAANKQSLLAIKRMRHLFRKYAFSNHDQRNLLLTARRRLSKIHEKPTISDQTRIRSE